MGIPKFFRWMSERYPAISQLIAENRIPEFDCLYLDMNGIIHNCTHKDSDSPTHRMTEDKMFIAIFNYIEHLFGKIRPRKLFYMAIDGVAPRAKMNQQRARRFRTALDAEKAREKAVKQGATIPSEAPFDSNCITPGTEFMAKLSKQLKYFINKKISEDADWQGIDIVLSGHEVPGEGEHKIMEYIRVIKSQPQYEANMRHCLYGLDADLIMLGLLSHDPHFCLLREEVSFGRQSQKKSQELEHQNFYLMHLCMVREYLELEVQELKHPGKLNFPFDLERIIDDFVLMAFFVGNDFLPNLPNLHINEGALALMFSVYKKVLPTAGGYINEFGIINLERLGLLLDGLSQVEFRFFESDHSDANWLRNKRMSEEANDFDAANASKGPIVLTRSQRQLFLRVKEFVDSHYRSHGSGENSVDLSSTLNAGDRQFVANLARDLNLTVSSITGHDDERHLQLGIKQSTPAQTPSSDFEDEEASIALMRVMKRYERAKVEDKSASDAKADALKKYNDNFLAWKNKYYKDKFGWTTENTVEMRKLTEMYVQGLQWVLYYYYRGVVSWPWFYAYHYSPMISDVKRGLQADLNFKLGQPFRPFQQLMGVLPDRSRAIVPQAYHDLMTSEQSPIIDFYPRDFELDMNGKKMEWEAVVKIPFIDETRLLAAMGSKEQFLSDEERARNEFGVSIKFTYSPDIEFVYTSSFVGIFPDIPRCHCVENIFELPASEGSNNRLGLVSGALVGKSALYGFPSIQTLPNAANLGFHGVNVFQQESRNESMVITLLESDLLSKIDAAKGLLGSRVHIGYPFLSEAKVVRVSDEMFTYSPSEDALKPAIAVPHGPKEVEAFHKKAEQIETTYSRRLGIVIGPVASVVHVEPLKGLVKTEAGAMVKEFGCTPGIETEFATQTIVETVENQDERFLEKGAVPIQEEFPTGSRAFFLGDFNYGRPLEIVGHTDQKVDVWVSTAATRAFEFGREITAQAEQQDPYSPSFAVAKALGLSPLVLSKITSSFQVMVNSERVNLGLNLKFEAKKLKVLGYSRRGTTGWEFSGKAMELIRRYMIKFPEFIAGIQRNTQGNIYKLTDFYPEDSADAKVKEIQAWLQEIEIKSFQRVPLDAEQLDSGAVLKIEEASNKAFELDPPGKGPNKKIRGVPRSAVLKPADAENRLSHQKFALGDRVVYIQDSGRVPIATRGTVVGKTSTARTMFLDIVFDVTFMSGTSLDGRCSPFRGSTVPSHSVLNLTNRQAVSGSKAGETHRSSSKGHTASLGDHSLPVRLNGRTELKSATIPPPLHGSFRNAISASRDIPIRNTISAEAGAGRGSANAHSHRARQTTTQQRNGGSHLEGRKPQLDTSVQPGNTKSDAIDYNNVPPPADLRKGHRTRGNGRLSNESRGRGASRARGRGGATAAKVQER